MTAEAARALQRVLLAVEGVDPRLDREAAWRAVDIFGEEIFGANAVNPTVGRRLPTTERHSRRPPYGS